MATTFIKALCCNMLIVQPIPQDKNLALSKFKTFVYNKLNACISWSRKHCEKRRKC